MTKTVVLLGGSGFVGRSLAQQLTRDGWQIRLATRRSSSAQALKLLPTVSVHQVDLTQADSLAALLNGADALINLIGVLHSPPAQGAAPYGTAFARAHVEVFDTLLPALRASGVKRLLHLSALGAAVDAPSEYQRSKAAGEARIQAATDLNWTIFRPSVIFGPDDQFLNLFARLSRVAPLFPLAMAHSQLQPVFIGDVVSALCTALNEQRGQQQVLPLAGPQPYTLGQLVEFAARSSGHPCRVLALPEFLGLCQARLLECLPGPLMSRDNIRSLKTDNITDGPALPFGLTPQSLEALAPHWLSAR